MLSNGFSSIKMRSVGEQKKLHISKFSETKKYSQKSLVFITTRGYFFAWLFPWLIAKQANRMALQRVVRLTCGSFLRRTVCPWWSPDEHSCQSPRQGCVTRPPPVTQTVTKNWFLHDETNTRQRRKQETSILINFSRVTEISWTKLWITWMAPELNSCSTIFVSPSDSPSCK